jgi:hypothetical protein
MNANGTTARKGGSVGNGKAEVEEFVRVSQTIDRFCPRAQRARSHELSFDALGIHLLKGRVKIV